MDELSGMRGYTRHLLNLGGFWRWSDQRATGVIDPWLWKLSTLQAIDVSRYPKHMNHTGNSRVQIQRRAYSGCRYGIRGHLQS